MGFIPTRAGKICTRMSPGSSAPVHPHSRGENGELSQQQTRRSGSSPLARGKCIAEGLRKGSRGFIPTRAGKMLPPGRRRRGVPVHPHSRGENQRRPANTAPTGGSSPLARGKSCATICSICDRGFIPTRAGKMAYPQARRSRMAVHPHSRGENGDARRPKPQGCGSSPLARGKSEQGWRGALTRRFIPTRAGKMQPYPAQPPRLGVHPHSRGENSTWRSRTGRQRGSSPLARGKWAGVASGLGAMGFIPTRAGKISSFCQARSDTKVHPHSRGENSCVDSFGDQLAGSSPLARGKCPSQAAHHRLRRFIPTRAGKMRWYCWPSRLAKVHPHSRGENSWGIASNTSPCGSSPLARGKSGRCAGRGWCVRFIPTRAGKIDRAVIQSKNNSVHPHSRGENVVLSGGHHLQAGSSPLARGKYLLTG